ncbi:hypothetical protein LguiA_026866 [Lonicera macranthoides]
MKHLDIFCLKNHFRIKPSSLSSDQIVTITKKQDEPVKSSIKKGKLPRDTRKTFTDHLYTALVQAGLRTFRDDDDIERGKRLELELCKAIQHSRISIIVLSKNYVFSKWCLDEVVMILEWSRSSSHTVLPVFYDVDPFDVRNQEGSSGEAFARYEE